jgi:sulfonate transport system substrate-binding protein
MIEWNIFAADALLLGAPNVGAIDCGGVGYAPFAFARAAGVKAKVITATRSSGASTALLIPATSTARTLADLKGRMIGPGKGSVSHFLILVAREKAGLSADDVNLAFLLPAAVSGTIDAWSTCGHYVHFISKQNTTRTLLNEQGLMSGRATR